MVFPAPGGASITKLDCSSSDRTIAGNKIVDGKTQRYGFFGVVGGVDGGG